MSTKPKAEIVAGEWRRAYEAANKTHPPVVQINNGWFKIQGVSYRRHQILKMTETLWDRFLFTQ